MSDLAELQRLELAAVEAERLAVLAGKTRRAAEEAESNADNQMRDAQKAVFDWLKSRLSAQRIAAGLGDGG